MIVTNLTPCPDGRFNHLKGWHHHLVDSQRVLHVKMQHCICELMYTKRGMYEEVMTLHMTQGVQEVLRLEVPDIHAVSMADCL